ncbi:MAG: alpha-D-ribose 1-methylphosphonate 5-phosphate C-P-lyase PhnJ, partial [Alphaproteobacteria bacterium]|nr:alpha-D-ribose 1-methylphosphonate 5-phosphate C-P-lyase PhnJ [Alphaproteobacteria bacterium]
FFARTAGVATTTHTREATVIQTRHRIPETPLAEGQILVYQVPIPEPLRFLEPRETETRAMHALEEYGLVHVKLYEDIARHGHIATTYAYPVKVEGRYVMDPSPIPKFDNPKMDRSPALQLFGAGREKRIYAIPPHTSVVSLDFEDHPFEVQTVTEPCALCGSNDSFLDEIVVDDSGRHAFVCSDTDYCERRRAEGHEGAGMPEGYLRPRSLPREVRDMADDQRGSPRGDSEKTQRQPTSAPSGHPPTPWRGEEAPPEGGDR